jgi:ribosomal protein S18 acetylase RimI-like enzyme
VKIRPYRPEDRPAAWHILEPMLRAGETYALPLDMTEAEALAFWTSPEKQVFVAEADNQILGTYFLKPNQLGGGSHVANCGYVTSPQATGRGVARAMCTHSLEFAKSQGFRAIQFNFVVSTNTRAVRLWQSFGFGIVGSIPQGFLSPSLGYVDALVMFRSL